MIVRFRQPYVLTKSHTSTGLGRVRDTIATRALIAISGHLLIGYIALAEP